MIYLNTYFFLSQDEVRDLIDGYDYLNAISSQIPNSIRKTAEDYKSNLLSTSPYSLINIDDNYDFHMTKTVSNNKNNIMNSIENSTQQLELLKTALSLFKIA